MQIYELMKQQLGVQRDLSDLHPELDTADLPEDEPEAAVAGAGGMDADDFDVDALIAGAQAAGDAAGDEHVEL